MLPTIPKIEPEGCPPKDGGKFHSSEKFVDLEGRSPAQKRWAVLLGLIHVNRITCL